MSVTFHAGPDGIRVRAKTRDAAVEYQAPSSQDNDEIDAPFELLNDIKGAKQDQVQLETTGGGQVVAGWTDGIPQVMQYDPPSHHDSTKFPFLPEDMKQNPGSLLTALHHAVETADAEATRYATNYVQLDSNQGRIVATDGRQVLVQDGFEFPWDEQVLIPRRTVFACKELANNEPVLIGRSEDWVTIQVGPWTFHLLIEKEGRYPAVEDLIRRPNDSVATLCVSDGDAGFLAKALKRLPTADEFNRPVTIDLNGAAVIRAQSVENQSPTELLLSTSTTLGDDIHFNTNRRYLGRALKMGFREVSLYGPEVPAICHEGTRHYIWALLGKEGIIKPSRNAIRISSQEDGTQNETTKPRKTRNRTSMSQSTTPQNGTAKSNGSQAEESVGVDAVIENAEALKVSLRDSLAKTSELIASLRRHKKANKSVQTALASLRQLQTLDA
jgi:hypothetical protein